MRAPPQTRNLSTNPWKGRKDIFTGYPFILDGDDAIINQLVNFAHHLLVAPELLDVHCLERRIRKQTFL